jgi:hypothetical protein
MAAYLLDRKDYHGTGYMMIQRCLELSRPSEKYAVILTRLLTYILSISLKLI